MTEPARVDRAQWRWDFSDRADNELDHPVSPVFTSRFDAELWLGEHWRGLATDRIGTAQLRAGERLVGPPVPLRGLSTPGGAT